MLSEYCDGMQSSGPPPAQRHEPAVAVEDPHRSLALSGAGERGDAGGQPSRTDRSAVTDTGESGPVQGHLFEFGQRLRRAPGAAAAGNGGAPPTGTAPRAPRRGADGGPPHPIRAPRSRASART